MKLAVFDFDSTLMDGETLDIIARETNFADEIAEITARGMRGEIDFFESLQSRVALLKGIKLETVNDICNSLPIMNGAKETIEELHKKDYKCVCFSGGFKCSECTPDLIFRNPGVQKGHRVGQRIWTVVWFFRDNRIVIRTISGRRYLENKLRTGLQRRNNFIFLSRCKDGRKEGT